jgi:S1-C subfamily serine protease
LDSAGIGFDPHGGVSCRRFVQRSIAWTLGGKGLVWKPGVVVTPSDALEAEDDLSVIAAAGKVALAQVARRDPTTDLAVLRRLSDNLPEPAQVKSARQCASARWSLPWAVATTV